MASNKRLTSVKIDSELFEKFKEECLKDVFTFQKLAERSIYLYMTDEAFKQKLTDQVNIGLTK
jgi:hypothetical protein